MATLRMLVVIVALAFALAAQAQAAKAELPVAPGLLAMVQPRIAELREAGISQIVGRAGARNNVQVLTRYGPAYARWPKGVAPVPFELYFNDNGTNSAFAADFNDASKARYAAMLDAVIPAALRQAETVRKQATRVKP